MSGVTTKRRKAPSSQRWQRDVGVIEHGAGVEDHLEQEHREGRGAERLPPRRSSTAWRARSRPGESAPPWSRRCRDRRDALDAAARRAAPCARRDAAPRWRGRAPSSAMATFSQYGQSTWLSRPSRCSLAKNAAATAATGTASAAMIRKTSVSTPAMPRLVSQRRALETLELPLRQDELDRRHDAETRRQTRRGGRARRSGREDRPCRQRVAG